MTDSTITSIGIALGGAFVLGFITYVPEGNPVHFVVGMAGVAVFRIVCDFIIEAKK